MKTNRFEIKKIKEDLEKEISQRNYTSLRYVLFNKNSKISHATHFYYENNKYYIENRDERGELIGNPYIFEDLSKAKKCFFEILRGVVALNNYYNATFGEVPYGSPRWSKSSKDDNKITEESSKDACRGKMEKGNQIGQGKDRFKNYVKYGQAPRRISRRDKRNNPTPGNYPFCGLNKRLRDNRCGPSYLRKERLKKEENIHMTS